MRYAYSLGGGAPLVKRYKIAATHVAGVPVLVGAASGAGLAAASTTGAADAVGVTNDASTAYSTVQGDAEGLVSVIINPDAVYDILLTGSAAAAALAVVVNSAAETAGTVITITTGDAAPNSPTKDEGTAICVGGANFGQFRKITSVAATTATVTVPFLNDIASGDQFLIVPAAPGPDVGVGGTAIQLTTALTAADASAAWSGDASFRLVEMNVDFYGSFPTSTTYRSQTSIRSILGDHIYMTAT